MHVLMLGWEFPPFISGGLGAACRGLCAAMGRRHVRVTYVLPKAVGGSYDRVHGVRLVAPQVRAEAHTFTASDSDSIRSAELRRTPGETASTYRLAAQAGIELAAVAPPPVDFSHVTFKAVPAWLGDPYAGSAPGGQRSTVARSTSRSSATSPDAPIGFLGLGAAANSELHGDEAGGGGVDAGPSFVPGGGLHYGADVLHQARRYAALCVDLARGLDFDVVHAHDWPTYAAGLAIAAVTGKPLVAHVHSTEFDRAGGDSDGINLMVYHAERRGIMGAQRVIAVSSFTRSVLTRRYAAPPHRVDVVYNGVDPGPHSRWRLPGVGDGERVVLFLGRLTRQKGPAHFLRAARRIVQSEPGARFIVAGSGDMAGELVELAAHLGLGSRVTFTGFVPGPLVDRLLGRADVFVMPSAAEPFGIAALEAARHGVPIVLSRRAGVSEVLQSAMLVDFDDVDQIARSVLSVLRSPALAHALSEGAFAESDQLTWDRAADACLDTFRRAIDEAAHTGLVDDAEADRGPQPITGVGAVV